MTSKHDYYYYASGKRVSLELDSSFVVVDTKAAAPGDAHLWERVAGRLLGADLLLINRSDLSDLELKKLEAAGALGAVFNAQGAQIVPLPEVRVEDSSPAHLEEVTQWVRRNANRVEVVSNTKGRMVLKPRSGFGLGAIEIANELSEQLHPALAQARFLRFTDSPSVAPLAPKRR